MVERVGEGELSADPEKMASFELTITIPLDSQEGEYEVSVTVISVGAEGSGKEVTDTVQFSVHVAAGPADEDPQSDGGEQEPSSSQQPDLLLPLGVTAGALLLVTFPWWSLALMFLLAPLMARLKKGDAADRKWRDRIYATIVGKPGVHFSSLKQWLEISNGTLVYNLEALIKEGKIVARRDGFFKRYYPVEAGAPPEFMDLDEKIAIIIRDNPQAALSEIVHLLEESKQKVHYHIKKMLEDGIIESEKGDDGLPRYSLAEGRKAEEVKRNISGKTLEIEEAEGEGEMVKEEVGGQK
jgi:predicted transcriptional regulator